MNYIDIINQALGTNYLNLNEVYSLSEVLTVCLKDERLYDLISYFKANTWTKENQDLFADILEFYKGYILNINEVTSQKLLTKNYKVNSIYGLYFKAREEALNLENVKLALENNQYNDSLFRDNKLVLKVYLENKFTNSISFTLNAWNEENANLYIKNISELPRIRSFYNSIICFKEVIKNHKFNLCNDFWFDNNFVFDEKIGDLLYQKMIEFPNDVVEVKIYFFRGLEPYFLKGLIKIKRYDLVDKYLNNNSLNSDNLNLLLDNFDDYLKATNNKLNYNLKDNLVFYKLFDLKKFDVILENIYWFKWDEESIRMYFDLNLDNNYYNLDFFKYNSLALKVYILGNYQYNIKFSDFNEKIVWTEENIQLYFDYLKKYKPNNIIDSFSCIDNYIRRSLEQNIFLYLDKGFHRNYDDEIYDLIFRKMIEFPEQQFCLNSNLFSKNSKIINSIILTKRFNLLDKFYVKFTDEQIKMFVSVLDEYLELGYDIPDKFRKSSSVTKRIIELNRFDKLNTYTESYNIENITLIANKYLQGYLNFYDISCRNIEYFHYAIGNLNVKHYNSFYNYKYQDPFFNYLNSNKISDLHRLISYYEQKKIVDEYIKDGFITDKFKKVLIFNHGYQSYCKDNNINLFENIDDLTLLSYLKCAYKVSNLHEGIFINETNYHVYFDEKGPKQELYDFLFNVNSIDTFKTLIDVYPNEKIDKLIIYGVEKIITIENIKVKKSCFDYFIKHYEKMNYQKVDDLLYIVDRIEYSNSLEMHNFQDQMLTSILESEKVHEEIDKIENIFLKENIPMFSKIFLCFKFLYPNFSKKDEKGDELFKFNENSRISPDLLLANPNNKRMQMYKKIVNGDKTKIRFQLIFNDLLRCAICSNNKSLIDYLNTLKNGNEVVIKLQNNNYNIDILNNEEEKIFNIFINYLTTIYENINNDKILNMNIEDKCKYFVNYFKSNSKYSLADRVVRSFGYFAGIDSLEQIFNMINDIRMKSSKENIKLSKYLEKNKFELNDNDLIRGIGYYNILGNSLENGNVCKELLGSIIGKSDSDTTPLDVDITLAKKEKTLYDSINNTPTGWGFGNVFVVLKNDVVITRDKDGNILNTFYDPMKMEVFGTHTRNGGFETHWGGRSGFSSTDVKCFIYKKITMIDSGKPYNEDGSINYIGVDNLNDLLSIKFEIARHGLYIPIVDLTGKLIFSLDEYNYIRSKMMGLSYYGVGDYLIDKDSLYFDGIDELINLMEEDRERVTLIRKKIYKRIEEIIVNPKYNLGINKINDRFNGDLSNGICELIETGSTARFSNVPDDCDFDFLLKLDRKYVSDSKIVKKIINIFKNELKPTEMISGKDNRFRGSGIIISNIDKLDIDISIDQRRNDITYSSEKCLEDRYNTIKKQYPDCYPLVLANIVKAKQILKENNVYKKLEGGIGGIGVENWILQNGGSLKLAFQDFLNHAYENGELVDFKKFKETYHVFDFGSNHEPRIKLKVGNSSIYYAYDNYINDNMNESKYKKMAEVLRKYINDLELNNNKSL